MKISYNWLQKYFDKALPKAKDLADFINYHVFEVESIDSIGKDTVMDIKVMPDRAHYALCHKGIAREVKAVTGLNMNSGNTFGADRECVGPARNGTGLSQVSDKSVSGVQVIVEDKKMCRRYMARRIENISISESPTWLKESLSNIDARPINTVVDATNYIMYDIGQPLHAFDADKVNGAIIVRLAKKGEKIELLPERVTSIDEKGCPIIVEKDRLLELSDTDLIIADEDGPIAIAGVKGGKKAEISGTTKNIILESANFDPVSIRRTSTRLNIRNDSSKRYENEIIPELAEEAMNKVTELIGDLSKTTKIGSITDVFNSPSKSWNVKVSPKFVSNKMGIPISVSDFTNVVKLYDCEISNEKEINDDVPFNIIPPLDRLDLKIPEDFVDEVARAIGYDKLKSVLPAELGVEYAKKISDDALFYWSEKVKNTLISLGYSEAFMYSLVSKGYYEIAYPLANDKCALRESIVPKMSEGLVSNALNADLLGLSVIKIFEIGKVFLKEGEKTVLCLGVKNVKKSKKKESEILKETMAEIEKILGVKLVVLNDSVKNKIDNIIQIDFDEVVKALEKIKPAASMNGDVSNDLAFEALPRDQKYHPFSMFPFITRDIAVFVPESVIGDGVWKAIKQGIQEAGAEELLVRDSLFDVFKKEGKVSYAYRLVFQSYEKTLTDEEVNKIMDRIYTNIRERGWEVR
jgi:phenylalanyl-tRNA synthetase beta chain